MVILWLVSANFRSAAANVASAGAGFGYTASSSGGLLGAEQATQRGHGQCGHER